ncbi:MAG: PD-(D/E)XK nuclease family protein [Thermoguttaceae bacterium]|jgi:hypothetical protein
MALSWSFSSDRCFRRCQRQYYFREIAAWHNAKDTLRREAFLLKQLKTMELWRGLLVHEGIECFVIPYIQAAQAVDWDDVIVKTTAMANQQFAFSSAKRYREKGITKSKAGKEYCALLPHERGETISQEALESIYSSIERCFRNLARMDELWAELRNCGKMWAELPVRVDYEGVGLEARLDLLFFRSRNKATIIDWKAYESQAGSDAHLQTALYGWSLCRHPKWFVQNAEDIQLIEVQLLDGQLIRHPTSQASFEELEDRVYRSICEIRSLCGDGLYAEQDLSDYQFASNPNNCQYCPFRPLCSGV